MRDWLDARRIYASRLTALADDPFTRAMVAVACLAVAFLVVTTPAWLAETRMIDGANVWTKPQKFNISMLVHFLTLAVLGQQVPRPIRAGPSLLIAGYFAVGAMAFEQAYITIQAARGRRSHFNFDTTAESLLYALMGIGALLLVCVAIVLAVQIARKGEHDRPGLRLGSVLGLSFGAIATIAYGGYMSDSGSHWVGTVPPDGASVPFFGWSREVGDLRPAHFVALHMMQTLPLLGYCLDRLGAPSRWLVWIAATAQLGLATFLFLQALGGRPFWPMH